MQADYTSPVPQHLQWRAWAADPEGRTGEELLTFIRNCYGGAVNMRSMNKRDMTMKHTKPRKDHPTPSHHRPMPVDPKELARAMFRQADQKMFGGRVKKKPAQDAQAG